MELGCQPLQLAVDFIQGVQQVPELRRLFGAGLLTQAELPGILGSGQAAQGSAMFQLGFFRFIQSDFQPYFFSFSTQNNSSILSDFRCGRGYSGGLPWGWILPRGGGGEIRCSLFHKTGRF